MKSLSKQKKKKTHFIENTVCACVSVCNCVSESVFASACHYSKN